MGLFLGLFPGGVGIQHSLLNLDAFALPGTDQGVCNQAGDQHQDRDDQVPGAVQCGSGGDDIAYDLIDDAALSSDLQRNGGGGPADDVAGMAGCDQDRIVHLDASALKDTGDLLGHQSAGDHAKAPVQVSGDHAHQGYRQGGGNAVLGQVSDGAQQLLHRFGAGQAVPVTSTSTICMVKLSREYMP